MNCTGFKIYAEPTVEPVTAADMRDYLRIPATDTGHDTLLSGLISATRIMLERTTGRIFCSSTYDVQFASFAGCELVLPVTPVQSITSITYKISNVSTTLASSQYELQDYKFFPSIKPAWEVSWPDSDDNTVVVRVLAGAATVYDKIGVAIIKAIVADVFEHPEMQIEISLTENKAVQNLLNCWRTR